MKKRSTEHVGQYVECYQKFILEGLTDTPYELRIEANLGMRWQLDGPLGEVLKAHKAACSTKPYNK